MPLNDRQIKNAKPVEKPYKLTDGHGRYLLIKPNGGKSNTGGWIMQLIASVKR